MQFTPLKQVLDERLKRRLSRSHLSETMNDIEAERRSGNIAEQEHDRLQQANTNLLERLDRLAYDVQFHRNNFEDVCVVVEERNEKILELETQTRELQAEIDECRERGYQRLKRDYEEMLAEERRIQDTNHDHDENAIHQEESQDDLDEHTSYSLENDDDGMILPLDAQVTFTSPAAANTTTTVSPSVTKDIQTKDASCSATLPDPSLTHLHSTISTLTTTNTTLTTTLSSLHDRIHALNFPPSPDLSTALSNISTSFRATRFELERLLPGETPNGYETGQSLLFALLTHISDLIGDRRDANASTAEARNAEAALRNNLNSTLSRLQDLERERDSLIGSSRLRMIQDADEHAHIISSLESALAAKDIDVELATARITALEAEHADVQLSNTRLRGALEKYTADVARLEELVHSLEAQNFAEVERREGMALEHREKVRALEGATQALITNHAGQVALMQAGVQEAVREARVQRAMFVGELEELEGVVREREMEGERLRAELEGALRMKVESEEKAQRKSREVDEVKETLGRYVQGVRELLERLGTEGEVLCQTALASAGQAGEHGLVLGNAERAPGWDPAVGQSGKSKRDSGVCMDEDEL